MNDENELTPRTLHEMKPMFEEIFKSLENLEKQQTTIIKQLNILWEKVNK